MQPPMEKYIPFPFENTNPIIIQQKTKEASNTMHHTKQEKMCTQLQRLNSCLLPTVAPNS